MYVTDMVSSGLLGTNHDINHGDIVRPTSRINRANTLFTQAVMPTVYTSLA